MEKLVHKRLIAFLKKYKILYLYQFGFRKDYSTTLALIEIVDNIIKDLQDGKYVAGLYIDFSKAFDTVDHDILLYKLNHYGIRGDALEWFKSYLKGRNQYTVVNGTDSDQQDIKYGVPQGSVLGPLLFLIYTNDIAGCTTESNKTRLFADDTASLISRDTPKELKSSLRKVLLDIIKWCNANKLTINLSKTCYIIYKTPHQNIPSYLNNITINNETITKVPSTKYLGIIMDEKLNWLEHIENLIKSLIRTSNSFKIVKHRMHKNNKIVLYNAYIYSKIQYGIEVYGRASKTNLQKVQVQQNRALKILYNKDFLTPTSELHRDIGILKVSDIYKLGISKFVYKHKNSLLPSKIFDNLYQQNDTIHRYNTRQAGNIHVSNPYNKLGETTIKHQGTTLWNLLPQDIKTAQTIKSFSKKVKSYHLQQY